MRRFTWVAVGAAAGIGGRRWLAVRVQQAAHQRAAAGDGGAGRRPATADDGGRSAGSPEPLGATLAETMRVLADAAGPVADAAGSAGAVAGRTAARLAAVATRRAGERVRHAVDGGRADARAREAELRHSWGRPSSAPARPWPPARLPGRQSGSHGQPSSGR